MKHDINRAQVMFTITQIGPQDNKSLVLLLIVFTIMFPQKLILMLSFVVLFPLRPLQDNPLTIPDFGAIIGPGNGQAGNSGFSQSAMSLSLRGMTKIGPIKSRETTETKTCGTTILDGVVQELNGIATLYPKVMWRTNIREQQF